MKIWNVVETFWWVFALKGAGRKRLTPPSMRAKAFNCQSQSDTICQRWPDGQKQKLKANFMLSQYFVMTFLSVSYI